ncbi:MAG: M23 family metallopeptidase, partial [Acidimicrobiia bacterium]|nr:M23 family metallopeptidase [Acidimicrobiia bacterium]
ARADEPDVVYFPIDSTAVDFTGDFGVRAKGRVHQGVDLFAAEGTPVVAVSDGFVKRLSYGSRPGWYAVVRHADGVESWYLHLDHDSADGEPFPADLKVGDFVAAGTVIGFVGDSGNAAGTDPHVHFELHDRGRRVNPFQELVDASNRLIELDRKAGLIQ